MRRILAVCLILLIPAFCSSMETRPQDKDFSVYYFYSDEGSYEQIEIKGSKLIHTFFEDKAGKCRTWVQSRPCWGFEDLETQTAVLSAKEINEFMRLIKDAKFMGLSEKYGKAGQYQRYYPYTLSVTLGTQKATVVYQSFPAASPMPEAFRKVRDRLTEIVREKFR